MNPSRLSNLEIISHPPPLPADLLKLADKFALHAGERAALAVGFQAHGTIGLILCSHRRGLVSKIEMLQLLRDLPARTTLHIHKDFLAVIVARAETETN
jgi:predicted nucleic acid-binding protein